jgi:adenylate cyclase class IV
MATELELKAVVKDAERLRARIRAAGAELAFTGVMRDRRFDRGGELASRDEVLRVRAFQSSGAPPRIVLGWKGPTRRSSDGYKEREEHECQCTGASPETILARLGYQPVHAVDRWIEQYALPGTMIRLETYPRMDTLVEIEGLPTAIETAIQVSGIARDQFSAEPLAEFVRRFEQRTGTPAVLDADGMPEEQLPWRG